MATGPFLAWPKLGKLPSLVFCGDKDTYDNDSMFEGSIRGGLSCLLR